MWILLVIPAFVLAEGERSIIQPDKTLLIVFVLFIVFVVVMNYLLFKPIGRILDERETLTDGAAAEARAAARQYQARLANYEETIRQARADSYRKLEQQRAVALEERRGLLQAARAEADAEIAKGKARIGAEATAARTTLEAEARQIAEQISRTVLGRAVGGGRL